MLYINELFQGVTAQKLFEFMAHKCMPSSNVLRINVLQLLVHLRLRNFSTSRRETYLFSSAKYIQLNARKNHWEVSKYKQMDKNHPFSYISKDMQHVHRRKMHKTRLLSFTAQMRLWYENRAVYTQTEQQLLLQKMMLTTCESMWLLDRDKSASHNDG